MKQQLESSCNIFGNEASAYYIFILLKQLTYYMNHDVLWVIMSFIMVN